VLSVPRATQLLPSATEKKALKRVSVVASCCEKKRKKRGGGTTTARRHRLLRHDGDVKVRRWRERGTKKLTRLLSEERRYLKCSDKDPACDAENRCADERRRRALHAQHARRAVARRRARRARAARGRRRADRHERGRRRRRCRRRRVGRTVRVVEDADRVDVEVGRVVVRAASGRRRSSASSARPGEVERERQRTHLSRT